MKLPRLLALSIAALGAGIAFGTVAVGSTNGPDPSTDPGGTLGVEARSGQCVQNAIYTIKDELPADTPRSPEEAVKQAQADAPSLGRVQQDKADPNRFERFEDGRKVAAIQTESAYSKAADTTVWYVTQSEFATPCDYVNEAHLKASQTVPEGVIPADPEKAAPADKGAAEAERNRQRAAERVDTEEGAGSGHD